MRERTGVEAFYEPPVGHWRFGAFPPDYFLISMAFEVGGTHEDWGWIMYEKEYVSGSMPPDYKLKTFVTARKLDDLLEKADQKMLGSTAAYHFGAMLQAGWAR